MGVVGVLTRRIRRTGLVLVAALLALVLIGAAYQAIATVTDSRNHPPPGQLVDVGGYSPAHLLPRGTGTNRPSSWTRSFRARCRTGRGCNRRSPRRLEWCAYDRAGLGWSDGGPMPRDAVQQAAELHTLLANAGVTGPYVLVGTLAGRSDCTIVRRPAIRTRLPAWCWLKRPTRTGGSASGSLRASAFDHGMLTVAPLLGRGRCFRLGLAAQFTIPTR
jgi:hypothetical protein